MALGERIERNVDLTYFEGKIPVNYVYTYGLGLEKFFRAIKEKGEFMASRCPECGTTYFPCRVFCERCFSEISTTYNVPGTGRVESFTVCHLNLDGTRKEAPQVVGLIRIDGAEDATFIHMLDVSPDKASIGMKVKPVLKQKKDREGSIFDIICFRP